MFVIFVKSCQKLPKGAKSFKSCDYAIMSANLGGLYIGIGYIFDNNWEICVSWRVSVRPKGAELGNVDFLEYKFVLDLHCQQLGNMLEGVYAPFGRGLGECAFSRIYICAIFRSKICLFAIFHAFPYPFVASICRCLICHGPICGGPIYWGNGKLGTRK